MSEITLLVIGMKVIATLASLLISIQAFKPALAWSIRGRAAPAPLPDLYEASVSELQDGLEKGAFTSVDLVKVSLEGVTVRDSQERNMTYISTGVLCSH